MTPVHIIAVSSSFRFHTPVLETNFTYEIYGNVFLMYLAVLLITIMVLDADLKFTLYNTETHFTVS